jgi:hypothetical protein
MRIRNRLLWRAGIIGFSMSMFFQPHLFAHPKRNKLVNLTILYTGDEYGYLEPCG